MAQSNEESIDKGFAYAKQYMADVCEEALRRIGRECLSVSYVEMLNERTWQGFTGNAQNSMAGVLYKRGAISSIVTPRTLTRRPIHNKVDQREVLTLRYPYEGHGRSVRGRVELESGSAAEAISLVASMPFKSSRKTLNALRLTMAVEYNDYLRMNEYSDPYTMLHDVTVLALQGMK